MKETGPRARRKAMEFSSMRLVMFTKDFSKGARKAVKVKNNLQTETTIGASSGRVN